MLTFFEHANIPDLPSAGTLGEPSSIDNFSPVSVLLGLIGTTNSNTLALGITSTPSQFFGLPQQQVTAFAFLNSLTTGQVGLSATSPDSTNGASGSWLVKLAKTIVGIDIKPGSDPNCFNVNGHGVIPVAILGSASFSVADIDPETLKFGSFMVRVRGNKGPLCSLDNVNGDEFEDLVCHFDDAGQELWEPNEDATATLTGTTFGGTNFEGTDSICVKP